MPQLSMSTSSMVTTRLFVFLCSTSPMSCVTPAMSAFFWAAVTWPSLVILILTYGMVIPSFCRLYKNGRWSGVQTTCFYSSLI